MADMKKVQEFARLVRRLETFDLAEGRALLAKLPPGIIALNSKTFTWKGATYLRTEVSILDPQALQSLDLSQYAQVGTPDALKAGEILQRCASFEPDVVLEGKNFLPQGMITTTTVGLNQNNHQNNNKKKIKSGLYWTVPFEEIKAEFQSFHPVVP